MIHLVNLQNGFILFLCLFLEMLWVKKGRNLRGVWKHFPIIVNIFPMRKIWNYFSPAAFVDKTIGGSILYNLFYQPVVNMGEIIA